MCYLSPTKIFFLGESFFYNLPLLRQFLQLKPYLCIPFLQLLYFLLKLRTLYYRLVLDTTVGAEVACTKKLNSTSPTFQKILFHSFGRIILAYQLSLFASTARSLTIALSVRSIASAAGFICVLYRFLLSFFLFLFWLVYLFLHLNIVQKEEGFFFINIFFLPFCHSFFGKSIVKINKKKGKNRFNKRLLFFLIFKVRKKKKSWKVDEKCLKY